jgi:hypothetical protein
MIGGEWTEPRKGTLAGENVEIGQIYDDARLAAAKPADGGYSSYQGSGLQHLYNVRALQKGGDWVAQYAHEKDPKSMLRIRVLDQPGQQVMLCDARVSPVNYPQVLRYLIARRTGDDRKLQSRFVSVIEPFKDGKPSIKGIRRVDLYDDCVGLDVLHESGDSDTITYNPNAREDVMKVRGVGVRGVAGSVVCVERWHAGHRLATFAVSAKPTDAGVFQSKVAQVLPMTGAVEISADDGVPLPLNPQSLVGRVIHFRNEHHRTAHTVTAAHRERDRYVFKLGDDLLVGCVKVEGVDQQSVSTSTAIPLCPTYRGTALSDELFRDFHPVQSAVEGKISLSKPFPPDHKLKAGSNAWLVDVAPGDTVEIPWITYQTETGEHKP